MKHSGTRNENRDLRRLWRGILVPLGVCLLAACLLSTISRPTFSAATVLLGDQNVEGNRDTNPLGAAEAFQTTAVASGSLASLSLYLDSTNTVTQLTLGLYSESGGHPGALLTQASTTQLTNGAWNTISVPAVNITSGTKYWIGILGTQSGTLAYRDRKGTTCGDEGSAQTNLTSLPSTWATGPKYPDCPLSGYGSTSAATQPILNVSPTSLSFAAVQGAGNPPTASVSVTNTGTGSLTYSVSSDQSWLTATPAAGSAPQTLTVTAATGSLVAGTYTGHLTVTATGAQGSPATVTVTFVVSAPPPPQPILSVSPLALTFSAVQGGVSPPTQNVGVTNAGGGTLNFSISSDQTWLGAAPASGSAPQTLTVTATTGSLAAGNYTGHLTVTATGVQGSPATVTVTFNISAAPPSSTVLFGDQSVESTRDTNALGSAEAFQTTAVASGSLGTISLYLDPTNTVKQLTVGLYSESGGHPGALLTQASTTQLTNGAWNTISVPAVNITSGTKYWIGILGTQSGTLAYRDRVSTTCGDEGSAQTNLTSLPSTWTTGPVYPDCPLSGYGSTSAATQPILNVSPTALSFAAVQGGSNPATASVGVTNTGIGSLTYSLSSDQSWLTATPASGSAPQTLTVTAATGSLVAGTYTGHLTVTATGAQGSPATVTVTFVVSTPPPPQPILSVSPLALTFSAVQGGVSPPTQNVDVTNTGSGTLNFTDSSDQLWLGVTPDRRAAPQTLTVTATTGSLAAGSYTGHLTITAPGAQGSPATVTVTFNISAAPPSSTVLLGDQGVESNTDTNALGAAEAFQTTATSSGSLASLSLYLDSTNTVTQLTLGLYSEAGGHPGTLLTQASTTQLTNGAWNTIPVPAVNITSGTKYWISILGTQSGKLAYRDTLGGTTCADEGSAQTNLTSLPSTWTTGPLYHDCPLSGYGSTGAASVAVIVAPAVASVSVTRTQQVNATVFNDLLNAGVTWSLSGSGCSGATCGTISGTSSASGVAITYTAPASVPSPATVSLRATSVTDITASATSTITIAPASSSTISVSVSPKRGGLTLSQSLNFTANVTNDIANAGVTWTTSAGTLSSQTTASATYVAPLSPGTITVTATSIADGTKSASATIGVTDLTGVTTYHNNLSRDGTNTHEYALTTSNVSTSTFGKLFSCTLDGAVYAQPLWVANVTISGVMRNVVIGATQHEGVYAFDADAKPCVTLWHANLIDASHGGTAGETSVPSGAIGGLVGNGYGDITPEVGITATPVIDPGTNTLFVVSKSVKAGTTFFQRLHALDLTTGNEKFGGPVAISASVSGIGDGSAAGILPFDPRNENQRPGLALVNGIVYVAWGSHEDRDPYHGWIIGYSYNTSTLAQVTVFSVSPNGRRGGIWMSGGAPAADSSSNLYVITGNGTYDGTAKSDYGDTFLKLGTTGGISVSDWFTPADQATLDGNDTDFGSGGAAILVDQPSSPVPRLVIGGGKQGNLFLLNRDNMGGYKTTNQVVQTLALGHEIFSTSAFWQNTLYIAGVSGPLDAFAFNTTTGKFNTLPSSQSSHIYAHPGATPSISSTGTSNGIVWALDNSQNCDASPCGPAVLHAYDATNLTNELWNSSQTPGGQAGNGVKFTVPTVANGKVYIGTRGNDTASTPTSIPGEVDVYGLLP